MKNNTNTTNEFQPVIVYLDIPHETATKNDMEVSRRYMQNVYDEFLKMDIGDPGDLHEMLMRPQPLYQKRIDAMVTAPKSNGRFAMKKSAYMDTLDLPNPAAFYAACESAKKQMYCAVPGLWTVANGRVVVDDETANTYINARSVYAKSQKQVEFVQKMAAFTDLWNDINDSINGELSRDIIAFNSWAQ